MLPKLFGIFDSYTVMMTIGIIAAFALALSFIIYKKFNKRNLVDLLICGSFAIVAGMICALLFQALYDFVENPSTFKFEFKMTFYGGLFGGILPNQLKLVMIIQISYRSKHYLYKP